MALTQFTTTANTAVQREIYARRAFLWATENNFFSKFTGKQLSSYDARTGGKANAIKKSNGTNEVVTLKDDLAKEKGDTVNFHIMAPIDGEGVVDDAVLEGNEETLTYHNMSTTIHQRRNAVVVGAMSRQRTFTNVMEDAKEALQLWMANVVEKDNLLALSGLANPAGTISANRPSDNRMWYGGQTTNSTVEGGLKGGSQALNTEYLIDSSTANIMGPKVISVIKRIAMQAGSSYPKIRPIMHNGKPHYIFLLHPYQIKALRADAEWVSAQQDANVRGLDNPLFSGAEGVYDGVVIHEYERIETRLGAGGVTATEFFDGTGTAGTDNVASGIYVARGLFLGAQAVVNAAARRMKFVAQKTDYENQEGVATGMIWNADKVEFNGEDYGVIAVDTAYVPD